MIGALIVDKPRGITSHDVVARVRRIVGLRSVGHLGTLDPFATGVLVLCIGRATRLAQFLTHLDKEYVATVRLGFATDSQDITGEQITPLSSSNAVSPEDLARVISEFKGTQLQVPPMFSAKKVAGERLYRAAREGREVERTPVSITVHSLDLIVPPADAEDGTRSFAIRVKCSSGTYVRTLAHDIGARLGVGAHLSELRRTAVGPFGIEAAFKLEELEARRDEGTLANVVVSPGEMLAHLPSVNLSAEGIEAITHGRSVETELRQSEPAVRICDENGDLVAVGSFDVESRRLKPRIVLIQTS